VVSDEAVTTTLARVYTARALEVDDDGRLWAVQRDRLRDHAVEDAVLNEMVARGLAEVTDLPGGEVALNLTQRGFYYAGRQVEKERRAEHRRARA
jgi:hypothetical protein